MTEVCNERWEAPRGDAPRSVPVTHVCALDRGHIEPCKCSCKAVRETPGQHYARAVLEHWDLTFGDQEKIAELLERPKVPPLNIERACPITWDAKRYCRAWGAKGPHGCKYKPGHEGVHRCPCGSKHD